MCRAQVEASAVEPLADLLRDICAALSPDDPDAVVVGPVDFGSDRDRSVDLSQQQEGNDV